MPNAYWLAGLRYYYYYYYYLILLLLLPPASGRTSLQGSASGVMECWYTRAARLPVTVIFFFRKQYHDHMLHTNIAPVSYTHLTLPTKLIV